MNSKLKGMTTVWKPTNKFQIDFQDTIQRMRKDDCRQKFYSITSNSTPSHQTPTFVLFCFVGRKFGTRGVLDTGALRHSKKGSGLFFPRKIAHARQRILSDCKFTDKTTHEKTGPGQKKSVLEITRAFWVFSKYLHEFTTSWQVRYINIKAMVLIVSSPILKPKCRD